MCGEAALCLAGCERLQSNINRSVGRKRHVVNCMQVEALREKLRRKAGALTKIQTWHSKIAAVMWHKNALFCAREHCLLSRSISTLGDVDAALLVVIANRIMCTSKVFVKWMSCSAACLNMCVTNLPCPPPTLMYVSTSLMCDCSWFQASTLTRGGVPRHNETFGCEIQNLTECIKAEQTADAKGSSQGQSDDFPFSYQLYHTPLPPRSQRNHQTVWRLCRCLDTDSHCLSY